MKAAEWLQGMHLYMLDKGLGQLPEIADGDAPHEGRGCIAQAWSVAELLRAAVEDVYVKIDAPEIETVRELWND